MEGSGRIKLLLSLVGLLTLAGVMLFINNQESDDPHASLKGDEVQISYSLKDNTLVGRSQGRKTWELSVEHFQVDKEERYITLSGEITGIIFRDGEARYWLTASEGKYDKRSQDLWLSGGLEVETSDGEKISAATLRYEHQTDLAVLERPLRVQIGKYTMIADQVEIFSNPERLTASGNVSIISTSNEEIKCDKLIYYREGDRWEISGAVELTAVFGPHDGKE